MRGMRRRVGGRVSVAFLLTALVIAIVLTTAGVALADQWTDISDAQWLSSYGVSATQAATVAAGYADGTFHPKEAVKRGQFAKMVVDGFDVAYAMPAVPSFGDVPKTNTFYKYIEGGVAAGILSGYQDGTYKPNNTISRQQANNILGSYLAQKELSQKGGITGSKGTYGSLSAWYAAEGIAILAAFNDANNVAAVHAPGTAYLVFHDVARGSNGYLTPGTSLTRAQAVTLILRVKAVTFTKDPIAEMPLALTTPTPGANNTIEITGTGSSRTVTVNVANGTTSVVLTGTKTSAQTVTKGGSDSASVTSGGSATAPTYTVNTSSMATAGGSRVFTLTLSETGKTSITYMVTVTVGSDFTLKLTTPAPDANNTITTTGSGATRNIAVNVANGTTSVVLTGAKTIDQTLAVGGANVGDVTVAGIATTAPTFTVNTTSIATAGGSKVFNITVTEAGKGSIVCTVTVSVLNLTADVQFALTSPAPSTSNTIAVTGTGSTRTVTVNVVNATSSVVLTGTKTAAQTVTVSGVDLSSVAAGGSATAPTYTISTSSIAAAGGAKSFTLTVSEPGKMSVAYGVNVTVAGYTAAMSLALTTPTPGGNNTISTTSSGGTGTVAVNVVNTTASVVLSGGKTSAQNVAVGGANALDVTTGGTTTAPIFTVNTTSIATVGGSKVFTLTLSETGKGTIVYTVTVTVGGPTTTEMPLALTTPAPGVGNTLVVAGSDVTRTVTVNVVSGTTSVVLAGTKTAAQTVTKGGTNASDVTVAGTTTVPTFTVNTSTVAATGGSKVFTLTLGETGRTSIVYTVTVTVGGLTDPPMTLALTTPLADANNTISVSGTGGTKTVTANVENGKSSVVLTGAKTTSQAVLIGGANAGDVTVDFGATTAPTFTVDTTDVMVVGGSRVFTIALAETGKASILYSVTVTVSAGYTTPAMILLLTTPTADANNTISVTGTAGTRTVAVQVENGKTSVVLTGTKTADQTVTKGGTDAASVTVGGGSGISPTFTVNTSSIASAGGSKVFTITLSETGTSSIVYTVTVTVMGITAPMTSLYLTDPMADADNTISVTGSGKTRTVAVVVENGETSVELTGTKLAGQGVVIDVPGQAFVTIAGGATATPTFTVITSSVAAGGSKAFTITLSGTGGEGSIVYSVTVTVLAGYTMPDLDLTLANPTEGADNYLVPPATSGGTRTVTVYVANGVTSVLLTGTKEATQTIAKGGTDAASVTIAGTSTAPTFTVNTSSVATAGGSKVFTLTVTETGYTKVVYAVTVVVAGLTSPPMDLDLTTPALSAENTISITGTGGTRTVTVSVVTTTGLVTLTGYKTAAQSVSIAGANAGDVGVGGSATVPTFTVDTSLVAVTGGSKLFTITLSEPGKASIVYSVTVTVGGPYTAEISLALTSPAGSMLISGGGASRAVAVNVGYGTTSVLLTGGKTSAQTVTKGGTDASLVTVAGTSTVPTFTVNTTAISSGGSKVFTLTVSEPGKTSMVYTVTVTVAPSTYTANISLALTSPAGSMVIAGSGGTRTVDVNVANGTTSVVLTGGKTAVQALAIGGSGASVVSMEVPAPGTTPVFTVDTSVVSATGGTITFTITVSEAGMNSVVYTVNIIVAGP